VSNRLGVDHILGLIGSLRATAASFADREERLNRDYLAKTYKLKKSDEESVEQETAALDAAVAEAAEFAESEKARTEARLKARAEKIKRSLQAARMDRRGRADGIKGRSVFEMQSKTLAAQKEREAEKRSTGNRYRTMQALLKEDGTTFKSTMRQGRATFRGFGGLLNLFSLKNRKGQKSSADLGLDLSAPESELQPQLRAALADANVRLKEIRKGVLPNFFSFLPIWLWAIVFVLIGVTLAYYKGASSAATAIGAAVMLVIFIALLVLNKIGAGKLREDAEAISTDLKKAHMLFKTCKEKNDEFHLNAEKKLKAKDDGAVNFDDKIEAASAEAEIVRAKGEAKLNGQIGRVEALHKRLFDKLLADIEPSRLRTVARLQGEAAAIQADREAIYKKELDEIERHFATDWSMLAAEWHNTINPIYEEIQTVQEESERHFPRWSPDWVSGWDAPPEFAHSARFGKAAVDIEKLAGRLPADERLALPGAAKLDLPVALSFPECGSVLFESKKTGREEMIGSLNEIVLRILSTTPPGKVAFTFIDPVSLGQSFANLMHLGDYEEALINSRIWTQREQIEQKLGDLNEHIEKIIQMYLRNEFETITEYNREAGAIAEKYQFLVVADFPNNFSDLAIRRLHSIAASGARCGLFTLIHWDSRATAPEAFVPDDLRKSSVNIGHAGGHFFIGNGVTEGVDVTMDSPLGADIATDFIHRIGKAQTDSNRVEVPFSQITPAEDELWKNETTNELRIPIGRTGATKLQYLAIGKGTRQHALFAGKTGSGKSTLFHVIITNLALSCSPDDVEFYLIDFKKGVEFKCYGTKELPHARVVAIESDREFGLSVLQRVDEELKRRGDMFRKLGVQDVAGYKRAGGEESMPRSLLIIDEFQEFFTEDDRLGQSAAVLLDRIVRQGRAFGIHVLLGSQTLGGAFTLARATLGQMVIRVALQCNEADAYLIMDDSNPAPRLLTRPGEGIYNDNAGAIEGNSPFQAVWLPEDVRDEYLDKVTALAAASGKKYPKPIVFEGNAPANVRENFELEKLLDSPPKSPAAARIWLGAPNSIKGPTEARFSRQSGNNLMIVGQRDEAAMAIVSLALISLSAQFLVGGAKLVFFDGTAPGTSDRDFLNKVISLSPHEIASVKGGEVEETMSMLAAELAVRIEDENAGKSPPIFVIIHGLQKFKKLRYEEDFSYSLDEDAVAGNPGVQLNNLICEGPSHGIHMIVTMDTYNNVGRFLSRKALSEFEMRVLFQMSANDSAALVDSPNASNLGMHRALYYNETEGYLETFRPYAPPSNGWLEEAGEKLKEGRG
jgi:S-DNA-T family DNA segregation ATPase FtsK/SpoIIIE